MPSRTIAKSSRRDFLRGSLALAGTALLLKPRRAWAEPEGEAFAADFVGPWGVAFDDRGRLYVSDPGAYRIVILDPNGAPLHEFGKPGAGPDRLNYPTGLAILGDDVFVCDTNNGRIAVWSLDGEPQRTCGGLGITTAKLAAPNGVCATEKWLWVANTRGHVVQRYDPASGVMDRAFGRLGDDRGRLEAGALDFRLRQPTAVAADRQGRVFVLDAKHGRVLALDEEGRVLWESRPTVRGLGLLRPCGLASGENALYVADAGNHRLLKLDEDGKTIDARTGVEDPRGVAVAEGRLAVAQFKPKVVRVMDAF